MAKDKFGMDWAGVTGRHFWKGPQLGRRMFFRHLGAGLGGYFLMPGRRMETVAKAAVRTQGKAKNCIFILMNGGPSHTDTFDLKVGAWTPGAFNATSYDGVMWPQGLFPKLAEQIDTFALVRSIKSWNAAHELAQSWLQIGRNPLSGLSKIAPHIGSIVSLELGAQSANRTMPAFVSLNTGNGPAQGYLPPEHAPFYVNPGGAGLANTTHFDGQPAYDRRVKLLVDMDTELRSSGELGASAIENAKWGEAARKLMYNPEVARTFTFDNNERVRYGNSGFGSACITAKNLLKANMGTRFVQITVGGWDMHANIYTGGLNPGNVNSVGRQFDTALGTLLGDLKQDGMLEQTLVVAMGEFGRTLSTPNQTAGRDHFLQQAALVAGAGIQGRRAIGSTDERGGATIEPGWARERDIRAEDLEATIYSALGIDWTTIRRDDPMGRGFEYVPFSNQDLYGPIDALWG